MTGQEPRKDLLCYACLDSYGGDDRRCPGIEGCRMSKYETHDTYNIGNFTEGSPVPKFERDYTGRVCRVTNGRLDTRR